MKATKTRNYLKFIHEGTILQSPHNEMMEELAELEAKASKWDMVQWALDKGIYWATSSNDCWYSGPLNGDFERLEEIYKASHKVDEDSEVE